MPENCQSSCKLTHEPQQWLSPQLAYTETFRIAIGDTGKEQRAAATIADQLSSSYLLFSLLEHARAVYACVLEHFPLAETAKRPEEQVVVSALITCLIRWQNEVEDMLRPSKEEVAAVSNELIILALSLLHPPWVMDIPDLPQPASAADEEAEMLLASVGYPRERLILALTEHALDLTSARLGELIHRLSTAVRQAADDELAEALQNLSYPRRMTKRRAQVLRAQIVEEIQQDAFLSHYFSVCRRIEVESANSLEYQIHCYFEAYGRHYGEIWIRNEKHWRMEADKIHQEGKEEEEGWECE